MRSEQLHSKILGLVSLIGLVGLWGCSKDETAEPKTEKSTEVQLASYVADFEEVSETNGTNRTYEANAAHWQTRGWTPPSGYSVFDIGEKSISVFFTQGTTAGDERFFYTNSGKWRVSGEENSMTPGTYYLYGYVPHDKSITSTVSVPSGENKTFEHGAVLTLTNIPAVSSADFCVMIAAKNGASANEDYSISGLQRGNFTYVAAASNYVYLLFDHLFSALQLQIRVQGDYNNLRTIKLKELKMQAYEGTTPTTKKMKATITLAANDAGNDPITDVVFESYGNETESGSVFTSEEGQELTADYQPFTGHFMPQGVTNVILESTYDVYDKKGNLVRAGCTAKNKLNLSMFSGQTQALRGCKYTVNLTINPTYLYMLSEPDLDNPTVTLE